MNAALREIDFSVIDPAGEHAELRQSLADKGWHQCAGPVELLVAVTAQHHKLTLLHQDAGFDTIARLTEQPVRRISD